MDFAIIRQVVAPLKREGVRYAIFGAAALNLHGLARFTEDRDVFLEPSADNVARQGCARQRLRRSEHREDHRERRRAAERASRNRGSLMPVRKFRSVEAMNQPIWREPGVFRFKDIAELEAAADRQATA